MTRLPAVASALLLSGCAMSFIDKTAAPHPEWPQNMKQVIQVESFFKVQQICRRAWLLPLMMWTQACTIPVLPYGAYVTVTYDPTDESAMQHEREHGEGKPCLWHPNFAAETITFWKTQGWKPGDTPLHFDVLRYDPKQAETVKVTEVR